MSNEVKIQKTTGGVVHMGTRNVGYFTPICGSGVVYAPSSFRDIAKFRELKADAQVTCKKCLKKMEKAEELGLYLEVRENEDGSSRVVDTRKEEAPVPATLEDQLAQIRANREAEEEARAAARRARNRTNYAPVQEEEREARTEIQEMEEAYQDLLLKARGLRLLSDELCASIAEMKDAGLGEDHPRLSKTLARVRRSLELEDENEKERNELAEKIREARKTGRCLQRGGRGTSYQCTQLRGHVGDCKNTRGETFTNWLDPQDVRPPRVEVHPVAKKLAENHGLNFF